jgi:hypothetical protein
MNRCRPLRRCRPPPPSCHLAGRHAAASARCRGHGRAGHRTAGVVGAWQRQHPDAVTVFDADGTLSRPVRADGGVGSVRGAPMRGARSARAAEPIAWPEPSAAAEIARSQFNLAVGTTTPPSSSSRRCWWHGPCVCVRPRRCSERPARFPFSFHCTASGFTVARYHRPNLSELLPILRAAAAPSLQPPLWRQLQLTAVALASIRAGTLGLGRVRGRRTRAAPRRAGARLPGAALARPRRGAAPPPGQAHAAAAARCLAVHRAGAGLGHRARALRAFHAGRPGGRGCQAQPRHARAGQLHQRLPAALPA